MKTIKPLIILLSIPLALWACREDNDFELKPNDTFSIKNGCGTVYYQSNVGKDSASAVDSIKKLYGRTCPWLWADSIRPQRLNVDFSHDSRLFWLLEVKEKDRRLPVYIGFVAVDSKSKRKFQMS